MWVSQLINGSPSNELWWVILPTRDLNDVTLAIEKNYKVDEYDKYYKGDEDDED